MSVLDESSPDYVCPNGHPFPAATTVACEFCEAHVACVPFSDAIRMHELLEAAETEVRRLRAALEDVTQTVGWIDARNVAVEALRWPEE